MAKRRYAKKEILYLIELYKKDHPGVGDKISRHAVAKWAIENGKINVEPESPEKVLRRRLQRAMRKEYTTDPQGREVRKYHTIVETDSLGHRESIAYEIFEAPPNHMRISFSQRRRQAVADVKQLELDLTSYNDNNKHNASIPPLDYDFNKDIEESKLPTEYPDEAPTDNFEEFENDTKPVEGEAVTIAVGSDQD